MTRNAFIQTAETILRNRHAALDRALGDEMNNLSGDSFVGVRDQMDKAADDEFQALAMNLAESESRELDRIESALGRIQLGEYGTCECCQRRIPIARLRVIPYATRCVKCQKIQESDADVSRLGAHWELVVDRSEDEPMLPVISLEGSW